MLNLHLRMNVIEDLYTFDSDLDDVVGSAHVVRGRAEVVASISFTHIRNLQHFVVVMERHPAAWELTYILLPGDVWSGPFIGEI